MNIFDVVSTSKKFTGFTSDENLSKAYELTYGIRGEKASALAFLSNLDQDVRRSLDALIQTGQTRNELVSFAIAKVVSDVLPIDPAAGDAGATAYFNDKYRFPVTNLLNFINEIFVIDIDHIVELVLSFFRFRSYCFAPDIKEIVQLTPEGEVDLFGINKFIPLETTKMAECNGLVISRYYFLFTFIGSLVKCAIAGVDL